MIDRYSLLPLPITFSQIYYYSAEFGLGLLINGLTYPVQWASGDAGGGDGDGGSTCPCKLQFENATIGLA
jgi:hypothetical protein